MGPQQAAPEERRGGKGGKGNNRREEETSLATRVRRTEDLALQLERRVRIQESHTSFCVKMPTDHQVIIAGKEAKDQYLAQTRGQSGHGLGSPHVHIGMAILEALAACPMNDPVLQARSRALTSLIAFLSSQSFAEAALIIKGCGIADNFQKASSTSTPMSRVALALRGQLQVDSQSTHQSPNLALERATAEGGAIIDIELLVVSLFSAAGGTLLPGPAPTGDAARKITGPRRKDSAQR